MKPTQNFANHRAWPPPAFLVAGLVLLGELARRLWSAIRAPEPAELWAVAVAAALLVSWYAARERARVVQDRVIRLEMQLRLERLLGAARRGDVARLGLEHLIALRFAGDAELPELFEQVLAGALAKPNEIKRRIRDWQADWLRV